MTASLRNRGVLFLACMFSVAAAAWAGTPDTTIFPAVPGWTFVPDSVVYKPATLYGLIDGAADTYVSYGFVDLHVGSYVGPGDKEVRVEVYRHASEVEAFGIYAQERYPEYRFLPIGAEGYEEEGMLNFLTGRHYVKLSAHTESAPPDSMFQAIARALVHRLGGSTQLPALLAVFPPAGRVQHGDGYVASSFLGFSKLGAAFTASYGGQSQLFVMPAVDSTAAAGIVSTLRTGKNMTVLHDSADGVQLKSPFLGTIAVVQEGRLVGGAINWPAAGTKEGKAVRLGEILLALRKGMRRVQTP